MIVLLHQLLAAAAETCPGATAARDGNRELSYGALDEASNRVAHLLVQLGTQPGDRIGIYMDKSLDALVGLYAVLKAGAAYVPLDPQAPAPRLAYIAQNCGISCVLSGKEKASTWAGLLKRGAPLRAIVVLNDESDNSEHEPLATTTRVLGSSSIESQPPHPPDIATIDLDLAYILYTSGSTGQPKGVMLSHLNAMSFVRWASERFSLRPEDRLSSHAPLHFDLSVFDVFAAAAAGASVTLVPNRASALPGEIVRFIDSSAITVWYSVPSVLTMLSVRGGLRQGDLGSLRAILFAGEVFPIKYLRRLMTALPHVRFHNLYGPTETNVCTHYEVQAIPKEHDPPIPIGRPITNVEVFALTDAGRQAQVGEVGELFVRGTTVMRGYWAEADRSVRTLVPDPLGRGLPDAVYPTGDLVMQADDGNYSFLGRRDTQIKSRGYRIEPGDLEAVLHAHPAVVEAVVVAVPDELVGNLVKACVVAGHEQVSPAELVAFCRERLPNYMVPDLFEFRDFLPKTSTGKVDRKSLCSSEPSVGQPS